ncbi:hypothetical protein ACFVH6_01765 [Spirillospora sp. NPDC127200]
MSAEPIEQACTEASAEPYELIHLGGETAAVVPLHDLRRLRALEKAAAPEALDEAEAHAAGQAYQEWEAAGRPGELSHDEAMELLLGRAQ